MIDCVHSTWRPWLPTLHQQCAVSGALCVGQITLSAQHYSGAESAGARLWQSSWDGEHHQCRGAAAIHLVSRHMAVRVAQTISVCPERTPQTARCDAEHMSVQGNPSSYYSAHHIMINSLSSLVELARDSRRILFVNLWLSASGWHHLLLMTNSKYQYRGWSHYISQEGVLQIGLYLCSWVTLTSDVTSCPGGEVVTRGVGGRTL